MRASKVAAFVELQCDYEPEEAVILVTKLPLTRPTLGCDG